MARPSTKAELINASQANYRALNALIAAMPPAALATPFDFAGDPKKKQAHWQRDRNLRDVLIHLHEWHHLVLRWVTANTTGQPQPFLPAPYNWKTYGDMNLAFWQQHQTTALADALTLFHASHEAVMQLVDTFTDQALFTKGAFDWVGGSTLGSYLVSATASHYDWAIQKLKAHLKNCGVGSPSSS